MGRTTSLASGSAESSRICSSMHPICVSKHTTARGWRTDNAIHPTGNCESTPILLSRTDWGEGRVGTRSQHWDVLRILSPSNILRLVHHSHSALASPVNVCLEKKLPRFQNRDLAWIRSSFWIIHRRSVWTSHPCLTRSSSLPQVRLLRKMGRMTGLRSRLDPHPRTQS